MKNIALLLFAFISWFSSARAQIATIVTYAHTYACNIAVDAAGKVYTATGSVVNRIDSGGGLTTVAGGGSTYGDGGPATDAELSGATNLKFDTYGNMYISDAGHNTVRKVSTAGIISTVAGTGSSGYTGDGGPATAANLNASFLHVDYRGNIYIADESNYVIRKVSTSGIITTIAGNGSRGYSGDGGAATAASLDNYSEENIWGMTTDPMGNLYISVGAWGGSARIRKVDTSGTITTFAGSGSSSAGSGGVGGPATAANIFYPQGLTMDAIGNLYIAEWQNCVLAVVNSAGILNTAAGNYSIDYYGDGGSATAAAMNAVSDVAIDPYGNVYISDCHNGCIRKVTGSYLSATHVADSFGVFIHKLCSGPVLDIATHSYSTSQSVKCFYGDGTTDSSGLLIGFSSTGFTNFTHDYSTPGTYTMKVVLMNSGVVFDSISYAYEYKLCNTLSSQFYYDGNSNCTFDSGETHIPQPILTEVDSNGVAIDTISGTSGFYYTAYGVPGDIYQFKPLSVPPGLHITCPSSGIISDTLRTAVYALPASDFGLACTSSSSFDLSVQAVIPVTGMNDQWGDIYVANAYCVPTTATVTLHFSPKYIFTGTTNHTPSSTTATSVTWILPGLSGAASAPEDIWYAIWHNPTTGYLTAGDTVCTYVTVSPTAGDADTSNNHTDVILDTVRASCDPNEISVTPAGNILAGTKLHYTVHFENTGTDTAFNIYVMDTLSDNVDISTFNVVSTSVNTMFVSKLYDSAGHNILKFDFPGINLLDSSHHDECNAMFMYDIISKRGLANGTRIPGRTGIYFDYNNVVMTNEVKDIIKTPFINVATSTTTICTGDTAHFTATSPTITNTHYRWYLNGTAVGTDKNTYSNGALTTGNTIKCLLWDGTGDTLLSTSSTITMTVNTCPDKVAAAAQSVLKIYPNPNYGTFTIQLPAPGVAASIMISDVYGKVVKSIEATNAASLDISNLPKGAYMVKVTCGGRVYRDKVVVW